MRNAWPWRYHEAFAVIRRPPIGRSVPLNVANDMTTVVNTWRPITCLIGIDRIFRTRRTAPAFAYWRVTRVVIAEVGSACVPRIVCSIRTANREANEARSSDIHIKQI